MGIYFIADGEAQALERKNVDAGDDEVAAQLGGNLHPSRERRDHRQVLALK
jgi:hypothetical protein